ncbi:unnamed protein product [Lathyrus sativus]|nr:unnamed protein product [Lathyrus sativus]
MSVVIITGKAPWFMFRPRLCRGRVVVVALKVFDYLMRRELAIKRVLEDGDEKCMREYGLFGTKRGDTIFTQCWTSVSVKIRGLVILMHGLNEHSGRYSNCLSLSCVSFC